MGGFILSVFLRVLYQNYVANGQQTLFKHSSLLLFLEYEQDVGYFSSLTFPRYENMGI